MATTFNPNTDYAALIAKETDSAKKSQLLAERQAKIDAQGLAGKVTSNEKVSTWTPGNTPGIWTPGTTYDSKSDSWVGKPEEIVPEVQPQTRNTSFNTQSLYDAQLAAKYALLEQNYNSARNTLLNAYNTTNMDLGLQKEDINSQYDQLLESIGLDTYENLQRSKEVSSARGIMNSAMGRAQDQSFVRTGSESVNTATTERNAMLNDLTTRINNLTKEYGNNLNTLEQNYASQKYGAQNEAMASKLATDLDLYKFDADWANKFALQDDSQEFSTTEREATQAWQSLENNLDRDQQWAISQLSASTQLKASQISANAQITAANLAFTSQANAQAFIEKQWETERADAAMDSQKADNMALYQANPYYDPNARVNFWNKLAWWDTDAEKATEINKAIVQLSSASPAAKQAFIDTLYTQVPFFNYNSANFDPWGEETVIRPNPTTW